MRHLIIGTAGHIDHGKTSLIKALTHIDCDTHKEEKERGITINLGFAHFNLPSGDSIGIVDVPGHKDFIKTMVAGAFGVDIVLLVIAADSGVMPQTIEHLRIVELLGVEHGIIVIAKKDLVDEETLELAELEITEFIQDTLLKEASIVKVSSTTGEGINDLISEIITIIPRIKEKAKTDLFRMYIDRVFNVKGVGFVVTGSVLGGSLERGDNLYLLPGKTKQLKVRNIERHGISVTQVIRGDRAALNLSGFKIENFQRGMVLSDNLLEETYLIDATFKLFAANHELELWTNVIFFSGTFECSARVHLLDSDKLKQGETAILQVHLDKPAILLNKDRYIIRRSSNDLTLGGGVIFNTQPQHHRRRTHKLIESLHDLAEATLNNNNIYNIIKIELKKRKSPVFVKQLANDMELEPEEILKECFDNEDGSLKVFNVFKEKILVSSDVHTEMYKKILDILNAYHDTNYLIEEGLKAIEIYGKLGFKSSEAGKMYLNALLDSMKQDDLIKNVGKTWALRDHNIELDAKSLQQLDWLENSVKAYGKQVPVIKDIETQSLSNNINKEKLKMLFRYLVSDGKFYVTNGEYIHKDIINEARKTLLSALKKKERGINEKEFRILAGGTKSFAKAVIRLFVEERIIMQSEFHIHLTETGEEIVSKQ